MPDHKIEKQDEGGFFPNGLHGAVTTGTEVAMVSQVAA